MIANKRLLFLVLILATMTVVWLLSIDFGNQPPSPVITPVIPPKSSPQYVADIQPIFNAKCVKCHGEKAPAGGRTPGAKAVQGA